MCRASTSVPVGGASGFETYFEPTASPENIMETTSLKLSANNEAKICRECEEEVTKYICVQCKRAVCTSCAEDHGEDCHTLVLLRGRNLDLERTLQMTNSTKCQKHGKLEMQFYCQTCKEPICEQCKLLRTHHRHAIEDLPESCVRAKESILASQKRVTSGIRLLETVLSDVERRRSELKRQKSQAEGAICAQAEEACRLVLARKTDALNELTDMVNTIDQQYALESDSVCSKLSGLSAIHDHLDKVLQEGTSVDLIRTWVSAENGVRSAKYLNKFISELPKDVFRVQLEQASVWPSETVLRFLGSPKKIHEERELPIVNVTPLFFCDTCIPEAEVFSLCPMRTSSQERVVWVAYRGRNEVKFVSLFSEDGRCLSKKSEPDKVGLVNINGHCRRTKLKEIVFSKRTLRAYIKCNVFNKEIVFDVPASVHLHDLYKQNGFVILCKRPLAMDANEDKTIFAVLDDDFRVYIFRRGESLPFSSYPPANSKSVVGCIADVCFYRLADREVLLLADKGHDDLHVVDVQRGCRLVRGLTSGTAADELLAEVTALNVDPETGLLWVGCRGGRILTCGDTGVQVESSLRKALGWLKIN